LLGWCINNTILAEQYMTTEKNNIKLKYNSPLLIYTEYFCVYIYLRYFCYWCGYM